VTDSRQSDLITRQEFDPAELDEHLTEMAAISQSKHNELCRRLDKLEHEVRADAANWNTGSPVSDPDCELAHRVWPILSQGWRQRWWDETAYGGRPGASQELVAVLHQRAGVLKLLQRKLPDDEWAKLEEYLQTVISKVRHA